MNKNKNAPAGNRGAEQNNFNSSIPPLELFLSRLDTARPTGDGWRVDCPNGHISRYTLSFKQADDGRVLLHCFAGCTASEALQAMGLELSDLYDRPTGIKPQFAKRSPAEIKEYRLKAAFEYLPMEVLIVQLASVDLLSGKPLDEADHLRLELAVERITSAKAVLCER